MAEGLRELDPEQANSETINSVFRAVHSIKGGAGAFKLAELVEFAHGFETLLDELREDRLPITADLLRIMHHAGDHLADMVGAERDGVDQDLDTTAKLKAEIEAVLPEGASESSDAAVEDFVPMVLAIGPIGASDWPDDEVFTIEFSPRAALYASGNEPVLLFRELAELGEVHCVLHTTGLPDIDALDANESYLS